MQLNSFSGLKLAIAFAIVVGCVVQVTIDGAVIKSEQNLAGAGDTTNISGEENVDEDVKELENLKPNQKSLSIENSQSSYYTDINGKKEQKIERKEELNKDGKLLARIDQKINQEEDGGHGTPVGSVKTVVDIPTRGFHKVITGTVPPRPFGVFDESLSEAEAKDKYGRGNAENSIGEKSNEAKRKMFYQHSSGPEENNLELPKYSPGVQFSPLDMAEYIFFTGDEKGVTLAIEEFLVEGLMSREDAITYLRDIKTNLLYLQKQYEEQTKRENSAWDRSVSPLNRNTGLLEKVKQARIGAGELADVRQQLRDNISKKSIGNVQPEAAQLKQRLMQAGSQGMSEEEYEDLLERLRVADFMYTEYSLEEIIYQLAKVMFSQSLTRGSSDAQEALEKFTRFLENEATNGRISRSLEKKVLDVLIASLTDTLTEHPELAPARRENIGGVGPSSINDQILQQLLILNPSAVDKSSKIENDMKYTNLKNHRFLMMNKNHNVDTEVPIPIKKSEVPPRATAKHMQDGIMNKKSN